MFKNRYVYRAKLTEAQFRKMLKCFALDLSATEIAEQLSINRNTVNKYVKQMRLRIAEFCEQHKGVELIDFNNYINGLDDKVCGEYTWLKGKISLGLDYLKRRGKVYSQLISNIELFDLKNIRHKIQFIKDTGKVHAIDVNPELELMVIGYDNYKPALNTETSYVDNLERYWAFVKNRLAKFNGLAKHTLYLHIKECEFRFNLRNDDLYKSLLKMFKEKPLETV